MGAAAATAVQATRWSKALPILRSLKNIAILYLLVFKHTILGGV